MRPTPLGDAYARAQGGGHAEPWRLLRDPSLASAEREDGGA